MRILYCQPGGEAGILSRSAHDYLHGHDHLCEYDFLCEHDYPHGHDYLSYFGY